MALRFNQSLQAPLTVRRTHQKIRFHLEELIKQKIINPQQFIKRNGYELNSIIKNN